MANYEKQTWVDGLTPINAARLNHMEDGIESSEKGAVYFAVSDGSSLNVEYLDKLIGEIDSGKMPVGVLYMRGQSSVLNYSVGYHLTNAGTTQRTLTVRFYVFADNDREPSFNLIDFSITRDYGSPDANAEWTVTKSAIIVAV